MDEKHPGGKTMTLCEMNIHINRLFNSNQNFIVSNQELVTTNTSLTLKDAELIVLMRTRGKLIRSHISKNILNQTIYYIITQEGSYFKTFLIDSNAELLLIEKHKI